MFNWKTITRTFLEGLLPLDALVERPVRPGSDANLIDVNHPNPLMLHFSQDLREMRVAMNRMMADLNVAVMKVAAEELRRAATEAGAPRRAVERHGHA